MKFKSSALLLATLLFATKVFAQTNDSTPATNDVNTAVIPTLRPSANNSWEKRHEGFVKIAQQGGIDILFMGDSITDFWRNRGSNVWNQCYAPRHAANFGISGDRTEHVLWRIDNGELDGIHPKVLVLLIGTNNIGYPADQILKGDLKIVQEIHEKLPDTK